MLVLGISAANFCSMNLSKKSFFLILQLTMTFPKVFWVFDKFEKNNFYSSFLLFLRKTAEAIFSKISSSRRDCTPSKIFKKWLDLWKTHKKIFFSAISPFSQKTPYAIFLKFYYDIERFSRRTMYRGNFFPKYRILRLTVTLDTERFSKWEVFQKNLWFYKKTTKSIFWVQRALTI